MSPGVGDVLVSGSNQGETSHLTSDNITQAPTRELSHSGYLLNFCIDGLGHGTNYTQIVFAHCSKNKITCDFLSLQRSPNEER